MQKKRSREKIKGPVFSIPDNLLQSFTMNGFARVKFDWFYSDTSAEVLNWTYDFYKDLKKTVDQAVHENGSVYYSTDKYIANIFQKYPILAKKVAIIGSATPLYEAYIDYFGGKPITIEYRKIKHTIPNLETYTFHDAVKKIEKRKLLVDHAFCYSSIEHSGLGRYGDEIDPDGDLFTMRVIKKMVKTGGLLFLQIPVGRDILLWNNTRIYGRYRLLLLLEGWKLLNTYGYSQELLNQADTGSSDVIFILQNSSSGNSQQKLFSNKIIEDFQALEEHRSLWHKKIRQLSSGFQYIKSKSNPRIGYLSPQKFSFKRMIKKLLRF